MLTKNQKDLINETVETLLEKVDEYVSLNYLSDEKYISLESDVYSLLKTLCEDYSVEEVEKYLA